MLACGSCRSLQKTHCALPASILTYPHFVCLTDACMYPFGDNGVLFEPENDEVGKSKCPSFNVIQFCLGFELEIIGV
ncbi:unnamed protein product [Pieris brassicae]|uniref:Uncharacterized protein n=1 Tax=Pieris brassicae TaxID=7116 RepID=A0A9P0T085_PIEBR|nr:unnamed protein product [Pieris brassicae]